MESQGRIAKLSSDDLQAKLMQAFAENEELAKKLREAEEALRDKVCYFDDLYLPNCVCMCVCVHNVPLASCFRM